jgi:hypothetical protein
MFGARLTLILVRGSPPHRKSWPMCPGLLPLALAMLLAACGDSGHGSAGLDRPRDRVVREQDASPPRVQRIVTVVLENTDYEQALAQPFLAQLARSGGLLTNYSAVSRPSQPNYFALTAGNTFGTSNDTVTLDVQHIGDLVEAKGQTWKVYAEQYSGRCDTRSRSGDYVRRHQPFISFKNVQTNPTRCSRIVNGAELHTDVERGTLPNYALYVPDLKNDGHDTGVAHADRWLSATFGPLLQDPRFRRNTLFVVTFDEGRHGNHIYTVISGDTVAPGSVSSTAYDHYSLLRTTEQVLGLGNLGQKDVGASVIAGIWR